MCFFISSQSKLPFKRLRTPIQMNEHDKVLFYFNHLVSI